MASETSFFIGETKKSPSELYLFSEGRFSGVGNLRISWLSLFLHLGDPQTGTVGFTKAAMELGYSKEASISGGQGLSDPSLILNCMAVILDQLQSESAFLLSYLVKSVDLDHFHQQWEI